MALTVTHIGSGNSNTTATTATLTLTSSVAIGDLIVVEVAIDNTGSGGAAPASVAITDSKSHSYGAAKQSNTVDPAGASAGAYGGIFTVRATSAMTTSDTITVTTATAAVTIQAYKVVASVGKATYRTGGSNTTTNLAAATITTPSVKSGDAVIAMTALERGNSTRNLAVTADSDTSNGSWSSQVMSQGNNSATSASNMTLVTQYKVVTGAATQTYNVAWTTATDGVSAYVIITEATAITDNQPAFVANYLNVSDSQPCYIPVDEPEGAAWWYDFSTMEDGPLPPEFVDVTNEHVLASVVDGYLQTDVDWWFSRHLINVDRVTSTNHLIAAEVEFLSASGEIGMDFASSSDGSSTNGAYFTGSGGYSSTYEFGSSGGSGDLGPDWPLNTPIVFHVEYDELTGDFEYFVDGVSVFTGGHGGNRRTGGYCKIFLNGNDKIRVSKFHYGNLEDGMPSTGGNTFLRVNKPCYIYNDELPDFDELVKSEWYDASDLTTITESSGLVTGLADKSGNDRDLLSTGSGRPLSGSTTLNGLNVLVFNGVGNYLGSDYGVAAHPNLTVFWVGQVAGANEVSIGVPHQDAASTDPYHRWCFFHSTSGEVFTRINGTGSTYGGDTDDAPHIYRLDSGSGDAFVDGVQVNSGTGGTISYPNSTRLLLGVNGAGVEPLNGYIGEVIIFDYVLDDAEMESVHNYLYNKWFVEAPAALTGYWGIRNRII